MEPPERDGRQYLLLTGKDRWWTSFVVVAVALVVLAADVALAVWTRHVNGAGRGLLILIGTGVGLAVFWTVGARLEVLARWAYWRRRAVPAMRLSADGVEYSAAYAGRFPLRVPWSMVEGSAFRPGQNGHLFWCVDVHPIVVVEATSSGILLRPVHPDQARSAAIRLARTAAGHGEQVDVDLLTHALAFGTPVVINLHRVQNVPLAEVDEAVRAWSEGRCSLRAFTGESPDP